MKLVVYYDPWLEALWLSDGIFVQTELFGEIVNFKLTDSFVDLIYLGEL